MKRPNEMTADRLSKMFRLALHFQGVGRANKSEYDELDAVLRSNNMSVMQLISALAPSCDDMLEVCKWKGSVTRCERLFQPVNTSEGLCCSFNYHGLASNNFPVYVFGMPLSGFLTYNQYLILNCASTLTDRKIAQSRPPRPRRVTACGSQTGITALLNPQITDYHTTFFSSYGFRVFIHDAYDYVDNNAETKALSLKMMSLLSVTPESTYSTDDVRKLPIDVRQCLMADEKKLKVMQSYSFANCMAECRSSMVFKLCGCVPYHMLNNGSYAVCEMNQIMCVIENQCVFSGALPGLNQSEASLNLTNPCDCLPDCEFNFYTSESTTATLNRSFSFSDTSLL